MYNQIIKIIDQGIKHDHILYNKEILENELFIVIMYIKYMCDNNIDNYSYENISNNNYLNYFTKIYKKIDNIDINIEKILLITKNNSVNELLLQMFKKYENDLGINIINYKEKKVCILYGNDITSYDRYGNTIYICKTYFKLNIFKLLDEMLNIKNEYLELKSYEDIYNIPNDIKLIYITDNEAKNILFDANKVTDICKLTLKYVRSGKDVIIRTKYKCISLLDATLFYNQIDKIIIGNQKLNDDSIVIFNSDKEKNEISIILYDKNKIKNLNALNKIIKDNKCNKEYLIKITVKDLLYNDCRIGFKLYSTPFNQEKNRSLKQIIFDNERLTNKLERLNEKIDIEMDNLINK